ncbi:hypothetical protein ALTERO38_51277 [Alteromonas sp. 38]|uniref:hypothetical protein n=1 Tax=Alteromonas TaxID=226 RepID=UPI0012F0BFEA|nr:MULTISPECIES: hypothetical protein [Alteromonas]CAD5275981.1 hypothetical protein ALTER154_70460 [Alteromonas sp. 154]VXB67186.1 hypothetical protein ALTERO38_51277 [Alteromonas sp. 38]
MPNIVNTFSIYATTVSIALTIIGGIALGTYTLGKDTSLGEISELKLQLSSYERVKNLDVQTLVKKLSQTAEKLSINVEEQRILKELKAKNILLTEALTTSENKLDSTVKLLSNIKLQNESLKTKLSEYNLNNKKFSVSKRQTIELIKGGTVLGLHDVSTFSSYAEFNVGNKKQKLEVGNSLLVNVSSKECSLTLLTVTYYDSAEFRLICPS